MEEMYAEYLLPAGETIKKQIEFCKIPIRKDMVLNKGYQAVELQFIEKRRWVPHSDLNTCYQQAKLLKSKLNFAKSQSEKIWYLIKGIRLLSFNLLKRDGGFRIPI